ncbi:AMP-binding protein [Mycolicibacterium sp.]|uniref:AMP-binding protein n=1 Tax=Mycolicibacterium sp. TaxID=2320850 RepID=UPI003D0E26E3
MTLDGILATTARRHPERTALIHGPDRAALSYRALDDAVTDVAGALSRGGLHAGDVVGLRAAGSPAYVVGLLGAARAGLTVSPLDPALPAAVAQQRLDMLGARILLDGTETAPAGGCPVWTLSGTGLHTGAAPRDITAPAGLAPGDAMIMLTSGTTGTPKMVPWTHAAIAAAVDAVARTYGLTEADATVAVMPLFHGHGLIAVLLTSLAVGGTVALPARERFSASTFWEDMAAVKATWYTAVPTIHQILLARTEPGGPDAGRAVTGLRFIRSCSAPLSPAVAERLEATFGAPVVQAYGMTEATHHISGSAPGDEPARRQRSVGRPVGATARIVDGEIQVSGPTIARGYLGDPALSAGAFTEGWLRTGDLGVIEDTGELVVTGRIKNIINRGGEKISPERVEEVLVACPGVTQAAVFPLPDPVYGERVAAAVVGTDVTAGELTAQARARLAPFEVPEHIAVIDELPLTAKGAVDRAALVGRFG